MLAEVLFITRLLQTAQVGRPCSIGSSPLKKSPKPLYTYTQGLSAGAKLLGKQLHSPLEMALYLFGFDLAPLPTQGGLPKRRLALLSKETIAEQI